MSVDLYIDYISQPSRAVLAFCRLSRIPVTIHEVRVSKMQVRSLSSSTSPKTTPRSIP